jgi:hypothetical protein
MPLRSKNGNTLGIDFKSKNVFKNLLLCKYKSKGLDIVHESSPCGTLQQLNKSCPLDQKPNFALI